MKKTLGLLLITILIVWILFLIAAPCLLVIFGHNYWWLTAYAPYVLVSLIYVVLVSNSKEAPIKTKVESEDDTDVNEDK